MTACRSITLCLCVGLLLSHSPATAREAEHRPYDAIRLAYAPYFADEHDPFGFAMKVKSLTASPYKFWRGSRDLFFVWCRDNTRDWLDDVGAIVPCHSDLHLGNIGTYACDEGWGRLAFGMVDFDDADEMPFQIELLQGYITMRLIAQERAIPFDGEAVLEAICVSYHTALSSNESETALLAANAKFDRIHDFIARESIPYARDLERFTEAGEFRHVVFDAKSKPQEILRPAMDRADALASAIGEAIRTSPRARVVLRFEGASDARSAIRDVALRTRLGSSGSQGLNKLLVLMNRPIRGVDHDVILYLKQQIPSAAQRNRVTRETPQSPAQRVCDSGDRLASPRLFLNVPCRVDGESYQMTLKEPWSDELDTADVKTAPDLVVAARVWGVVAGTAHREASPQRQAIPQRLTSDLRDQIRARGDEFAAKLASDFAASCSDPRVTAHAAAADQAITEFVRNATTHNERVWEGKQR